MNDATGMITKKANVPTDYEYYGNDVKNASYHSFSN
jgi:hypothetical protein